jgi:hypothetical protein
MGKIGFPKYTGTDFLVLPSGGVYVLAGKTKPACRSGRCANAGGLKLPIFFVRLVPISGYRSMKRDAWIENRMQELLPTAYYHMVFTLHHALNPLIMGNRSKLFDALFAASSRTLLKHAWMPEFLGAEPGITMVLHIPIRYAIGTGFANRILAFTLTACADTFGINCIVSAGGFDGKCWLDAKRKNNRFVFQEKSMADMFKAIILLQIILIRIVNTATVNW